MQLCETADEKIIASIIAGPTFLRGEIQGFSQTQLSYLDLLHLFRATKSYLVCYEILISSHTDNNPINQPYVSKAVCVLTVHKAAGVIYRGCVLLIVVCQSF